MVTEKVPKTRTNRAIVSRKAKLFPFNVEHCQSQVKVVLVSNGRQWRARYTRSQHARKTEQPSLRAKAFSALVKHTVEEPEECWVARYENDDARRNEDRRNCPVCCKRVCTSIDIVLCRAIHNVSQASLTIRSAVLIAVKAKVCRLVVVFIVEAKRAARIETSVASQRRELETGSIVHPACSCSQNKQRRQEDRRIFPPRPRTAHNRSCLVVVVVTSHVASSTAPVCLCGVRLLRYSRITSCPVVRKIKLCCFGMGLVQALLSCRDRK